MPTEAPPDPPRSQPPGGSSVSAERVIAAPPSAIFDILADPAQHPVIDGSSSVVRPLRGNPTRLALGSRFGMNMRLLVPYMIHSTVVEFEEDRLIAWSHLARHRWRYELEPLDSDGGAPRSRVTETFDWSTSLFPMSITLLGFPSRNLAGMARTLDRLEQLVVAESNSAAS